MGPHHLRPTTPATLLQVGRCRRCSRHLKFIYQPIDIFIDLTPAHSTILQSLKGPLEGNLCHGLDAMEAYTEGAQSSMMPEAYWEPARMPTNWGWS